MIKVVIVDDHVMFREGLRKIVEREADIEIVAEAGTGASTLDCLRKHDADVVVLDISLPGESGLEVLKDIRRDFKRTSVLMLSMHPEERYGIRAIQAGAAGYLTKENTGDELVKAIRRIYEGGKYVPPRLAEGLAAEVAHDKGLLPHERLSDREFEIMLLIGSGKTPTEIASKLNLSPPTVSTYRKRILAKMNMNTTVEIIKYVVENHLID